MAMDAFRVVTGSWDGAIVWDFSDSTTSEHAVVAATQSSPGCSDVRCCVVPTLPEDVVETDVAAVVAWYLNQSPMSQWRPAVVIPP
jgi:hypothetical protein